jgi:tripartite ATP-independent transporter DctP family solute receptor
MKRGAIILLCSLCSLAQPGFLRAGGLGEDARQERTVLRAADDHELSYPTTQGLVRMGKLLEDWTRGRITVVVYPLAQLGSERETIELTRQGVIDINRVNINPVTQIVPEFKAFALPYVFRDSDHMHKVVDGEIGQELMKTLESKELVGLGFYDSGQRSFYNSIHPIRSPEDLRGLRIRVQKADIMMDTVRALGAVPIPMSFEEVYTALQTGIIDGAENNYPSWVTKGHFETARFYTQNEHSLVPEIILFSKLTWDRLSEADRRLILEAARESIPYQRELWKNVVEESMRKAASAGCEIITTVDKEPFIRAMEPVYARHAAGLLAIVERIRAVE